MDYSNRLCSGSAARRRVADRDETDMIEALERGLDLKEADMAGDDSAAPVEIGQFEQVDASARLRGGGRRGGESSLPPFAVRQAGLYYFAKFDKTQKKSPQPIPLSTDPTPWEGQTAHLSGDVFGFLLTVLAVLFLPQETYGAGVFCSRPNPYSG